MTELEKKLCGKVSDPANCYKCIARLEQLRQVEDLSPEDRERIEAIATRRDAGHEFAEEDVAFLVKMSQLHLG